MIISFITSGDVLIWTGLRLTESTWWLQMTWHRKGTRPSATIMLIGVWQVKLKESYYRSACYNPGYTSRNNYKLHNDAIKWKHFPRYWPFVRSPQKGQWRGALMFSLICAWTNGWANNRDAGDLRFHCAHYDVTAMELRSWTGIRWYTYQCVSRWQWVGAWADRRDRCSLGGSATWRL